MGLIKDGWFMEINEQWPGQCFALKVKEILFEEKSKFQDILVFESETYGRVLVLDGVIQCTDRDECSFQEMIVHLPLSCHPNPRKVLIVGGGDGGAVREVAKYDSVEKIVQCEIDEMVIEVSKKYLPQLAEGFKSPKHELVIEDGFKYLKDHANEFDVIITDSSDPVGPAASLFEENYYSLMKTALKEGGIVCSQGECPWLHLNLIKDMQIFNHRLYPVVEYAYCCVPSYPSGQIGFCLCSKNPETNFRHPLQKLCPEKFKLKYYNTSVHSAAFVLPQFASKILHGEVEITKNGDADQ